MEQLSAYNPFIGQHLKTHAGETTVDRAYIAHYVIPAASATAAGAANVLAATALTTTTKIVTTGKMCIRDRGYAIRFNEPAVFDVDGVEYREVIDPRALDKTDMRDVPLRYNHSDNVMVMARTRNKTLQLIKDDEGLRILADLANTTAGRDLYELIKRGDVDKMSFAFTVARDDYDVETRTRRILAVDKIFDVSAVDSPAYETTSISVRSYFEAEAEKQRIALELSLIHI